MLNTFIAVTSAVIAMLSVLISYYIYKASRVDTSYLDIDKQYSELLKIGIGEPDLRDYEITSTYYKLAQDDDFKKKYNIYAYMCWNLVETIFDRQRNKNGRFKLSETWIPVLFEENRLHYTWFKHNLRLFKLEFQKFVTGELNDIEITSGTIEDFNEIYPRFKNDFASDESKEAAHMEMLMKNGKYKLLLARHKVFNDIVGYAFVYEIEKLRILWLDYMAIDPRFQNAGYGTLLYNKISELNRNGNIGMFLEVEIPDSVNEAYRDEQQRRIMFYERLGAKRLNVDYKLPTQKGGFPMYLYFSPDPSVKILPKEQIKESIESAFGYIHSDIDKKEDVLNSVLNSVSDEYFN